ncbi:hypothetical protein Barb4_01177 [Bacteroidales bacterium Barb4]|nr:hypothetical protein Barb4_01177 [Bacteroidales bacterium Barb4]
MIINHIEFLKDKIETLQRKIDEINKWIPTYPSSTMREVLDDVIKEKEILESILKIEIKKVGANRASCIEAIQKFQELQLFLLKEGGELSLSIEPSSNHVTVWLENGLAPIFNVQIYKGEQYAEYMKAFERMAAAVKAHNTRIR